MSFEKVQIGDAILYRGDCLEVMPTLADGSVSAMVITDPPYNIGFRYDQHKDNLSDNDYIELLSTFRYPHRTVMIQYPENFYKWLCPALGNPESVSAWCYNQNIPKRFRLVGYWNCTPDYSRIKQKYKNETDKRIVRLIEEGSNGRDLYEWWDDIQIVKNVSGEKTEHPCPIPVELAQRIIILCANEDDSILDPFMGSGTTGVACAKLGRKFIGIEISQQYFDIACKRIEAAQAQLRLGLE